MKSPRPGGFNPYRGLSQELLKGSLPELVVHAGAKDVVLEPDFTGRGVNRREGAGRERREVVELHIEVFALDRPAIAHRIFDAAAHGPAAAGIALLVAGTDWTGSVGGEHPLRGVDLRPGGAAGGVDHRLVPKPPEVGQAEPAARGDEPALLGLRNPVHLGREEWHEPGVEGLTRLVGRRPIALDAEHPHAHLPVAAALEAADEARYVERVGDRGSSRDLVGDPKGRIVQRGAVSCEMLAASGRGTGARTAIA